jgi:hypothetical protein
VDCEKTAVKAGHSHKYNENRQHENYLETIEKERQRNEKTCQSEIKLFFLGFEKANQKEKEKESKYPAIVTPAGRMVKKKWSGCG